jgi:predicted alpha/beta-fold hydrolase
MLSNRRPRLYHSGDTGDLDFLARTLEARDPGPPLFVVGVSLGGNVLLKWLGEKGAEANVTAAVAISTPYDLAASARHLESRVGRVYTAGFLDTLKRKAVETARRFPEIADRIDLARTLRARTFREFDDAANAPLHGFAGADDYYVRSSSLSHIHGVARPVLCLSAEDDPFLPREALARARAAAPDDVAFHVTPRGGHIGFVAGARPWRPSYWGESFAIAWMAGKLRG